MLVLEVVTDGVEEEVEITAVECSVVCVVNGGEVISAAEVDVGKDWLVVASVVRIGVIVVEVNVDVTVIEGTSFVTSAFLLAKVVPVVAGEVVVLEVVV